MIVDTKIVWQDNSTTLEWFQIRMLKAYKYAILPTKIQQEQLAQHFGCARHIYNWVIDQRKAHYEQTGKTLSKRALQDKLVHEEKKNKPWLNEVNSQSLLAALGHVNDAYQRFFKGLAKFPRYKSCKNHWQSYQCPQHVKVDFEKNQIQLPIIGKVKAKLHREFIGDIKTCTIKKTPHGAYQISVLVENHELLPVAKPISEESTVGVDVGLTHFSITNAGQKRENPRFLNQSLPKLRQLSQRLSRKQKGSNNREKFRLIVAKKHYQVARQREHALHAAANELLSDNQTVTIALEDLHIKGMVKNRKLSRHISDVAWSRFAEILQYKSAWKGNNVIYCNRFAPSSKQCTCGYIHSALTLSDRFWICPECHLHHDRDILAANNIKQFALAEAVGYTACVKTFPHDNACQRKRRGERSDIKPDGSQEAPTKLFKQLL